MASASFGSNGDAPVSGVSEGQDNDPLGAHCLKLSSLVTVGCRAQLSELNEQGKCYGMLT